MLMTIPSLFVSFLTFALHVSATVTIYTATGSASTPAPTICVGAVPCDGNVLTAMANPTGANLSQSIPIQLFSGGFPGLSLPMSGSFAGFSLELSVANELSEQLLYFPFDIT